MDKNFLYYNNKNKYQQKICIPKKEELLNYLIKEKFLSEFSTDEEKRQVLHNLGILQEINNLLDLLDTKVSKEALVEETLRSQDAESALENRLDTLEKSPSLDGIKHIIIRESQYNRLAEYEKDAIYLVIKDWTFGDLFPIVFTDTSWKFGDLFPIVFTDTFGK